jgi:glucuronate isomerase
MKKTFIQNNLLLEIPLASELYGHVKDLPVVDFHNHLNAKELAENKKFSNLTEAWLKPDPYKHRAMRICGVPEDKITGKAPDEEKFRYWAETLPKTIGNPLFVWSAMELKRLFGVDQLLSAENAVQIWEQCNDKLQNESFGAVDILKIFNVEIICTSDCLTDNLKYHKMVSEEHDLQVLPSLRGDSAMAFESPSFNQWFQKLEELSNQSIKKLDDYKSALLSGIERFSEAGCRLADHSLDSGFSFQSASEISAQKIFDKWINGVQATSEELIQLKNYLLSFLCREYARRNWTVQLHIGANRFTSTRLRRLAGPSGGYAAIGNSFNLQGLCFFLDELEKTGYLPKMIIYPLNPADYESVASLTGSYSEDGVPGKIQFGPAWWYNDQYEGIRRQLTVLANYGLISRFVGMTTDSRSVFSFVRHEYFRRILCNLVAQWVNKGVVPCDKVLLSQLVKDISYFNSKKQIFDSNE